MTNHAFCCMGVIYNTSLNWRASTTCHSYSHCWPRLPSKASTTRKSRIARRMLTNSWIPRVNHCDVERDTRCDVQFQRCGFSRAHDSSTVTLEHKFTSNETTMHSTFIEFNYVVNFRFCANLIRFPSRPAAPTAHELLCQERVTLEVASTKREND
jgi:hypothetical protein